MTEGVSPSGIWEIAGHPATTFVVGGVLGFLVSRFTLSKAERKEHQQRLYENARELVRNKDQKFVEFTNALTAYAAKNEAENETINLSDFQSVSSSGDLYFSELKSIASAVLSGDVDRASRDQNFVPAMREAIDKSLPAYYSTLQHIGQKLGVPFDRQFQRSNYEAIVKVVEKFSS